MPLTRPVVPDPVSGTIEMPYWLVKIKNEPAVRRMLFIKQLGLKAYIDFPGAMHTRYSHALGTMFLAGRVTDILAQKMKKRNDELARILTDNMGNMMAAGFLHDIGHGPFSHTVDFVLQRILGKSHEDLTSMIIEQKIPDVIEDGGEVNKKNVIKILRNLHTYKFLSNIIDGPLDVDKLDYLLRDAHHVGLKYSFDLDHFLRTYSIIGNTDEPSTCILGLENSQQAIVTGELFLVIWKSMYDLVYHIDDSRVAEKMLEKAILLCQDEKQIKPLFIDLDRFLELDDEKLLDTLKEVRGKPSELVQRIRAGNLYRRDIPSMVLDVDNFNVKDAEVIGRSITNSDLVSDQLSRKLCEKFGLDDYSIICDIVSSRKPHDISIEPSKEDKEPPQLSERSKVVGAIQPVQVIRVYQDGTNSKIPPKDEILGSLKSMIEEG